MSNNKEKKSITSEKTRSERSEQAHGLERSKQLYTPFAFFSSFSIHKEGNFAVLLALAISLIMLATSSRLAFVGFLVLLAIAAFFRDPVRVTPKQEGLIISPADGIVQDISETTPPDELSNENLGKMRKISIFLSVFDVHVNRMPCAAVVEKNIYYPGKFFNASLDKASKYNERQTLLLHTSTGDKTIVLVQIAGLIARRIVCYAQEGDSYEAGERYGIIKFGSRVDIYLPLDLEIKVEQGQRMIGGETIIAQL